MVLFSNSLDITFQSAPQVINKSNVHLPSLVHKKKKNTLAAGLLFPRSTQQQLSIQRLQFLNPELCQFLEYLSDQQYLTYSICKEILWIFQFKEPNIFSSHSQIPLFAGNDPLFQMRTEKYNKNCQGWNMNLHIEFSFTSSTQFQILALRDTKKYISFICCR